jgi:hypothetical protein
LLGSSYSNILKGEDILSSLQRKGIDRQSLIEILRQFKAVGTDTFVGKVTSESPEEVVKVKPFYFNNKSAIFSLLDRKSTAELFAASRMNCLIIDSLGGKITDIDRSQRGLEKKYLTLRQGAPSIVNRLYAELGSIAGIHLDLPSSIDIRSLSSPARFFFRVLGLLYRQTIEKIRHIEESLYTKKIPEEFLKKKGIRRDELSGLVITQTEYQLLGADEKKEYTSLLKLKSQQECSYDLIITRCVNLPTLPAKLHEQFIKLLGYEGTTLSYLMISQLLKLSLLDLCRKNPVLQRFKAICMGLDSHISVRPTVTELKNCPVMYLWAVVCNPTELSAILPRGQGGRTLIQMYNEGYKLFRRRSPQAKPLLDFVKAGIDNLPGGVKSTVFSRLGYYNRLRKESPNLFKLSKKKTLIQWSNADFFRHCLNNDRIDLINQEFLLLCAKGYYSTLSQSIEITKYVVHSRGTNNYYYNEDILSSSLYADLILRAADDEDYKQICDLIYMRSPQTRIPRRTATPSAEPIT